MNALNYSKRPTTSRHGMPAVAPWPRTVKCFAAIAIEERAGSEAKNCRRRLILSVIFDKKYYILSIIFDKIVYFHKQKKKREVMKNNKRRLVKPPLVFVIKSLQYSILFL
jgi:hypothetical protein